MSSASDENVTHSTVAQAENHPAALNCRLCVTFLSMGAVAVLAYDSAQFLVSRRVVQIALLMLIPLVIVLVWIALMYDKLLTNPFLAILLVLGVLAILFGGTIRFGPIKIQKKTTLRDRDVISTALKKAPRPQTHPAFQMIDFIFGSY